MVDPEQIHTAEELREQLGELFRDRGWSINRLAAESGLSTSTVKAILDGTTSVPQAEKMTVFVGACKQDPGPWVAVGGRAVKSARAPAPLVNLPHVETTFVGRTRELEELTHVLTASTRRRKGSSAGAGGVVVQAVHGLGGVGKSTLAAYWARTHLRGHEVA